jgi:hypothetical protein
MRGQLLGIALHLSGRTREGIAALESAADQTRIDSLAERVALMFTLAEPQLTAGDPEAAKATLGRAGSIADPVRSLRASVHLRMAAIEDLQGNRNGADWERQQARALMAD